MGITRVANVTGLDSIGIPVVMVSRPNSRSVAVSQGKGIDLASARASGLMESAELYHAETMTLPVRLNSYEELRYQHTVVAVDELPRRAASPFHPHLRLPWCQGRDLMSDANVLVPYEMVHADYTLPLPDGHGCFPATSNGLASGNNLVEAISHGLCEVVERDATTLWQLRPEAEFDQGRLDLASVDDPSCQEVLAKFERAGFSVAVWDITGDIGLATFACVINPREDDALWHSSVALGYGCHPARQVALLRALTEAAQARLTIIAGVRDDFRNDPYEQLLDPGTIQAVRDRVAAAKSRRSFHEVPHRDGETLEDDLEWELQCLAAAGLRRVIIVDLTKPEFALPVVRVIIPGAEPIQESDYLPGARGQAVRAEQP